MSSAADGGRCPFGFYLGGGRAGRALERALDRKPGELDLSSLGPPPQKAANTGVTFRSTASVDLLESGVSIMDGPVPPISHRPGEFLGSSEAQGWRTFSPRHSSVPQASTAEVSGAAWGCFPPCEMTRMNF